MEGTRPRASKVHRNLVAEGLPGHVLDGGHAGVARVFHGHVQATGRLDGDPHRVPGRRAVGHVQGDQAHALAVCLGEAAEGLGAPGGGNHVVAGLQDGFDEGTAQSRGARHDERHT
ncbi:hypothetical protein GCM10010236_07070 [Streptomyces eurythermus]|nr:hypothetical protein GCM10010236_07070 [Streptomyces eurythermus]